MAGPAAHRGQPESAPARGSGRARVEMRSLRRLRVGTRGEPLRVAPQPPSDRARRFRALRRACGPALGLPAPGLLGPRGLYVWCIARRNGQEESLAAASKTGIGPDLGRGGLTRSSRP